MTTLILFIPAAVVWSLVAVRMYEVATILRERNDAV